MRERVENILSGTAFGEDDEGDDAHDEEYHVADGTEGHEWIEQFAKPEITDEGKDGYGPHYERYVPSFGNVI